VIGSRNTRKLKKYSDNFNKMFEFYFKLNRSGLVTFCGDKVNIDFDVNGSEGKFAFREYENGRFRLINPITRHPNILKSVIIGKKGWGLLIKQWSEGIASGLFTKFEFFELIKEYNIDIPESFLIEFNNSVWKHRERQLDDKKLHTLFIKKIIQNNSIW
jgi:hypothetical protein